MRQKRDKIRIGVVGLGYLGRHHARILSGIEDVKLQALIDSNLDIAREMSAQYGGKFFDNFQDAIDLVDAFVIATPTESHYSIAKECLKQGKHLFIEKPITTSSQEALDLVKMSEQLNLMIQVGHIERFNPVYKYALNKINKPILIESERLSPFSERTKDTDVTLDLLIHDIDLVLTLLRAKGVDTTIKDITAEGLSMVSNKIDLAIATINFQSSSAVLKASRIFKDKKREMSIYEADSYLTIDFSRQIVREFTPSNLLFSEQVVGDKEELLRIELKSFVDALADDSLPIVTAGQALEALEVVEKINQLIGV